MIYYPDGTAGLSFQDLDDGTVMNAATLADARAALIDAALDWVAWRKPQFVRCLVPKDDQPELSSALCRNHFRSSTHLGQFTAEVRQQQLPVIQTGNATDIVTYQLQNSDGSRHPGFARISSRDKSNTQITELLQDVLDHSVESADIPRSSAKQLLSVWTGMDSELLLATAAVGRKACGIAAVSVDWPAHKISPTNCTLEYIGVLPEFRRHGVGRMLVQNLFAAIDNRADGVGMSRGILPVSAFVDTENAAAIRFYQRLRFREGSKWTVWIREW